MSEMEGVNIHDLVERLGSDEDAIVKMAVFKLQSSIGDPSFADVFISDGGLTKLRYLTLNANGNTLAYSLASFSRLLEVDLGWEYVNRDLVTRVVELVVTEPLVNILRGAMSILVAVVSHPQTSLNKTVQPDAFGFRALKPAIAVYPEFLEKLVNRLSSADHALCTNALQLINSLMRDTISNDSEMEWPKFIKKLQDLEVIKAAYNLMQSNALQDLAIPLLEFQALMKVLLRKWRDAPVDLETSDHRRALKGIHLASSPDKTSDISENGEQGSKRGPNPDKWRRLGFETESPAREFEGVGFLGMMDLADNIRKNEDSFQKLLLEQSTQQPEQRCPIARASLAVTAILYEHFEIDKADLEDIKGYFTQDSRSSIDKAFKPLLLQWSKLHSSGLQAFFRLWKSTGAEHEDFGKVAELVRILLETVVGSAPRTKAIKEVEEELAEYDYQRLRDLQMELLELTYEDTWGQHLHQVRDELNHEALQFIKEQRIRCLLQGAWFPQPTFKAETGPVTKEDLQKPLPPSSYRFIRLSHNRRYLHYADFVAQSDMEPGLEDLPSKIDLSTVSSVISNITSSPPTSSSTTSTLKPPTSQKITINGYPLSQALSSTSKAPRKEIPLLSLCPPSITLASEWLDGLLMLLNQQPITAETNKLIKMISGYGLKIRLLNVGVGGGGGGGDAMGRVPVLPGREGLDEEYWYDVFGG